MNRRPVAYGMILLLLCLATWTASAQDEKGEQPKNLLLNGNASLGTEKWTAKGEATSETAEGGSSVFVIRNRGYFFQDVNLPEEAVGQYAVLLGRAASERVISDRATTGFPSIYGYMMNAGAPAGGRVYAFLQGAHMTGTPRQRNEWVQLWGIFRIPAGTGRIRFFMKQDLQQGVEQGDPPARFRDLGVYLFRTEQEARAFLGPMATAENSAAQAPECKQGQAPALYDLRLGMSVDQVLSLFPGSSEDADILRVIERAKALGRPGGAALQIIPSRYKADSKYVGIRSITIRFLDGQVFNLNVSLSAPHWKSTDEFISSMSDSLGLPAPEDWNSVPPSHVKYLRCQGFEIRFLASPGGANSQIDLIDLRVETALKEWQAAKK